MGRWGKADFSQLKQLQKQIEQAERNIPKMMDEAAKQIAQRAMQQIIARTPDTNNDVLRKGWRYQILRQSTGYQIIVENKVEYASDVEYGHKTADGGWKPGRFMLHITMQDLENHMNGITQPIIDRYLKQIFTVS